MSFAENLKTMRKYRGLTQKQLAELSGISYSSIINYEIGRRKDIRKSVIVKLSQALNLPEEYFREDVELFSDGIIIGIRLTKDGEENLLKQSETKCAQEINHYLNMLNDDGQQEAVRLFLLLTKIPDFQRKTDE